jgi:hypothetical protein
MSVGVKVTLSESVPTAGTVLGAVQANVPGVEAVPPVNIEAESAAPLTMALAVGTVEIIGIAGFTVSCTLSSADV